MKFLLIVFVCTLTAGLAFAVADPGTDSVGIWFDLSADTNTVTAEVGSTVTAYLIISNSSWCCLGGFECTIEFDVDNCSVVGDWVYNGIAMNILEEPEFAVGYAAPLPTEAATWMVAFDLLVINPEGTQFVVGPAPIPSCPHNIPLCVPGEDFAVITHLYNATGYAPDGSINPCAAINADLPYAVTQSSSWSTIKT